MGVWLTPQVFHVHCVLFVLEQEAGLHGQTWEEEDSHCVGGFEETSIFPEPSWFLVSG